MLNFGTNFSNFCFLDNHEYQFNNSYECIAGVGSVQSVIAEDRDGLSRLANFKKAHTGWIFGHIGYDLKNKIENLSSENFDGIRFPDFAFFIPEIVFIISKEAVSIGVLEKGNADEVFHTVNEMQARDCGGFGVKLSNRFSKNEYLETVEKLQQHIARGDCYEICFCHELYAEGASINPVSIFAALNDASPNPFSAFYKLGEKYLMCASPERFLKKTGNKVISQPIKGTSKRNKRNSAKLEEEDKNALLMNDKERAENIMIVDLVRNDLSKICTEGSVQVDEFLKIYTFPQVHQMISTISGTLNENIPFSEIIAATFPMGSMTGAPKKKAMELIELYENTKRGLFSGSIGYFNPEGDFDFNVVIRSILYNKERKYLSMMVGSAITSKSNPEKEYEECNTKIEALKKLLG